MIPSISYDQHEILLWIRQLFLNGEQFECDPTFSKGNFYPNKMDVIIDDSVLPGYMFDISPQSDFSKQADCTNLPFINDFLVSLIFDPPFLSKTGKGSIMKERFGEFPSMSALWKFYQKSAVEFKRILQPGGILVWKCQNTIMGGKQWWSVQFIISICEKLGLDLIDEFVLLSKHRMERTGKYTQRHARKFHSYFLVFRKR